MIISSRQLSPQSDQGVIISSRQLTPQSEGAIISSRVISTE